MTRIRLWIFLTIFIALIENSVIAEVNSVFAEDTCAPPCWFGLIAGESTSADVENLITEYSVENVEAYGEFDGETQYLQNGVYEFTFLERETSTVFVQIQIQDSLVDIIVVHPTIPPRFPDTTRVDEYITLQQTLVQLGQPDSVYFYHGGFLYADVIHMTLIYTEARLRIELNNPLQGCHLLSVGEDMLIDTLTYYSPEAADILTSHVQHDELQPALTALHLGERVIPSEMWQQIVNGEIDKPCSHLQPPFDNPVTAPIIFDEPDAPRSLFDEDTCAPPCWFGLTPGESTSVDVATTLRLNVHFIFENWRISNNTNNIFDSDTGYLIDGRYSLHWRSFNRQDIIDTGTNIDIREAIVAEIRSTMNQTILLREVLERQGTPDYIVINREDFSGITLSFSYFELRTHIYFSSLRQCNISRMSNNFWVDRVVYYAPTSTLQAQTDVTRYGGKIVTANVWEQWVNGEETRSCSTAWSDLPESP